MPSHTEDSQLIVSRFFDALHYLIANGKIKGGRSGFCRRYNITRSNFCRLDREPWHGDFQPAWLAYLVRDYGISPLWLIMGQGDMFAEKCSSKELQ